MNSLFFSCFFPGAFNLLSSLNVLNLRENTVDNVTPFTFNGLDNLISIDLSQNLIRTVVPQVFRNNYLNEVNISGNLLKELEQDTFVNLPILEVLDLSHNNLVAIKNGAFNATSNFGFLPIWASGHSANPTE